ncbi:hypothetical protein KEM09_17100 [Carboxylicivirga mesophila]|uniref:Lipoprotein n=1 Tax=Carboxylicivirga mesophila TaxID=1166478 RepID=A0ABS5KEB0_9BACT|nr:hypothetical protein [Carboxylicivirga mesophila]MBS2213137.1 hypothetical protein [Carboxylicivirga mesophila]
MKFICVTTMMVLLIGCNCARQTSENGFEAIVKEAFGESSTIRYNAKGDYALATTMKESVLNLPTSALSYGIYNVEKKQLIFSEQIRGGSVDWHNNTFVMIKTKPEVQSIDREQNKKMAVYYINVKTGEKVYNVK